jgi:hypothetical protein
MFSMDVPVSQLKSRLGEGAVNPGNMQGSFEFPQLVDGPMLAAQTPKPYYLPTQVYGQMFPNELGKTKPKFGSLSAWPFNFADGGLVPGYHKGGPVGHRHGRNAPSTNRLNLPLSAGSTATMYSPATGLFGDPNFTLERAEAKSFEPLDNAFKAPFKFLWKAINPSEAPSVDKQTEKSKYVREQMPIAWDMLHKINPAFKFGSWLVKPMWDAATNIGAGDGKWNDYTSIASNYAGFGIYKGAAMGGIRGIKSLAGGLKSSTTGLTASKIIKPTKKIINLRAQRKAEYLLKQQEIAADIARFKANPPPAPPRFGLTHTIGAPSKYDLNATDDMFSPNFDWDSIPISAAPESAAKPSIFSKIASSPIGQTAKTLSRVASTPAYHLKTMARSANRAWRHGKTVARWNGSFDRFGRYLLAEEAITRLFSSIGSKANPLLKLATKTKNIPNVLKEGETIFDPLNFFEKLLLDTKRPGDFYKATYKNIIPNVGKNYVTPAVEGLRSKAMSGLHKMAGLAPSASQIGSKAIPIKDTAAAVIRSLSYKMKSKVKEKYNSFLNIFRTTKVGKPFDNAPIDYRTLLMTGERANTLHSPEIAQEILGGSQYYIKMLTKIKRGKEIFGSEWMHRIGLPAPVNRPLFNTPGGLLNSDPDALALASQSFAPLGYSTVKDFLAGATNSTNVFNPNDLGQVVQKGIVEQRISADVAQSVLGHMDLHPGNQIIDPATGKIGMLDFETILENARPHNLSSVAEVLKIQGVPPEVIARSLQKSLQTITDIPPADILDMLKRAKVPNPEQLLETYLTRLDMTKEEIQKIISAKLFLAKGGLINEPVPGYRSGGLVDIFSSLFNKISKIIPRRKPKTGSVGLSTPKITIPTKPTLPTIIDPVKPPTPTIIDPVKPPATKIAMPTNPDEPFILHDQHVIKSYSRKPRDYADPMAYVLSKAAFGDDAGTFYRALSDHDMAILAGYTRVPNPQLQVNSPATRLRAAQESPNFAHMYTDTTVEADWSRYAKKWKQSSKDAHAAGIKLPHDGSEASVPFFEFNPGLKIGQYWRPDVVKSITSELDFAKHFAITGHSSGGGNPAIAKVIVEPDVRGLADFRSVVPTHNAANNPFVPEWTEGAIAPYTKYVLEAINKNAHRFTDDKKGVSYLIDEYVLRAVSTAPYRPFFERIESGLLRQPDITDSIKVGDPMRPGIRKDLPIVKKAQGGMIKKYAMGGLIKGPGTGISDSIQAGFGYAGGGSIRVSNGEYVVKASSVRDYGVNTMDAINNGTATVGANSGGTVYNINMPVTSNNANPEIVANEVMRKLKLEISKNNKTNKVGG